MTLRQPHTSVTSSERPVLHLLPCKIGGTPRYSALLAKMSETSHLIGSCKVLCYFVLELVAHRLGIPKEHGGILLVEDWVVCPSIASPHRSLHDIHLGHTVHTSISITCSGGWQCMSICCTSILSDTTHYALGTA